MKKDDAERVTEELALVVHLSLVVGHALSAIYNYRRARKLDRWTTFHLAAGGLDAIAVRTHFRRLRA